MSAAARLRLVVPQGSDYSRLITWTAGAPAVPVDLSGASARMQVRATADAADVLDELSTTNGRVVLGGAAGTVGLHWPHAVSSGWVWRTGVWDLKIVWPDESVRRLLQGSIAVDPGVTRA